MATPDRVRKLHIVLVAAGYGLVGFFLQAGPLGNVFTLLNGAPTVFSALGMLLTACGFLAFLTLAGSAAVGLHLGEDEEKPGDPEKEPTAVLEDKPADEVRVRMRPELHQLRMIITALGGYIVLQSASLTVLHFRDNVEIGALVALFNFGLFYTAVGWFLLWQFCRWYAQQKRWLRLQDELVGMDSVRLVAVVLAVKPLFFLFTLPAKIAQAPALLLSLSGLSYALWGAAAVLIWLSRRETMRMTAILLAIAGAILVLLTLAMGIVEMTIIGR